MTGVRVVLVEDHSLVRAGLRTLLERVRGVEVVGEAADGREALELIGATRPDLVLMDIAMPVMNGLEATRRVVKDHPTVKVIILSMHVNEEYVMRALDVGASGYLIKDAGTEELDLAINSVVRGETYLSPPVSRHVVAGYRRRTGGLGALDQLSPRQREILQLISEGRTTQEIARLLEISAKTVETHRAQLMDRLNIRDVPGLVRFAIREGLISAES